MDFDVILDTNLSNRSALNNSIKEFGQRRDDYDVGFVYYAGHGIQINSTNYLLPTKVAFESVYDVQDNAVSVQVWAVIVFKQYTKQKIKDMNALFFNF